MIIHILHGGVTACLMEGVPRDWPADHCWSADWKDVTCRHCLAGKDIAKTFVTSEDGKSITCLRCKNRSYHPEDVAQRYCNCCHVFHEDIWPPARRWWVNHPDPTPFIL